MAISITPDNSVALPDNEEDDKFKTVREAVEVSATTAMVLNELGMGFDMTPTDELAAEKLFENLKHNSAVKTLPAVINTPEVAAKLGSLLQAYDQQVVADAVQIRTVVTNKLLLISDCGDPRYELKALELLGKISDVGLFTDKSEVTIRHATTEALEEAIREKVRRLIHANTVDVEPLVDNLEEELGLNDAAADNSGATEFTSDTAEPS
ncbi:MAG: hypothetical protein EBR82_56125 [Caulobacteraceae bacterium]|nr:hypothetical protein [Caulobacteraceae bacterium]